MAPLLDSRGNVRYFIGAQVDVTGLVKDCTDLDALQHLIAVQEGREAKDEPKDEFQELTEMFNNSELDTVRRFGGHMHREHLDNQSDTMSIRGEYRPRVLIKDRFESEKATMHTIKTEGKLAGVYKDVSFPSGPVHPFICTFAIPKLTYDVVRPYPPRTIAPHPLCLPLPPRARHSPIPLSRPNWRLQPRPRLPRRRPS
jgi:hypothetical protein